MKDKLGCCGLNCEKCDAKLATVNDDDELRKKTSKLWSSLNGVDITPEMINCYGCRSGGVKTYFCENLRCQKMRFRKKISNLRGLSGNEKM